MLSTDIELDDIGPLSDGEMANAKVLFTLYLAAKVAAIFYLFIL